MKLDAYFLPEYHDDFDKEIIRENYIETFDYGEYHLLPLENVRKFTIDEYIPYRDQIVELENNCALFKRWSIFHYHMQSVHDLALNMDDAWKIKNVESVFRYDNLFVVLITLSSNAKIDIRLEYDGKSFSPCENLGIRDKYMKRYLEVAHEIIHHPKFRIKRLFATTEGT